jgi:hypothetical protein
MSESTTGRAPVGGSWQLDPDRCALEASYRPLGVTLWRARLTAHHGRIEFPDGPDGVVRLAATVGVRPAYASVPGTGRLFLHRVRRSGEVDLMGYARPHDDGSLYTLATAAVDSGQWRARLALRLQPPTHDRVTVAVFGRVLRSGRGAPPHTPIWVEMAAEFVRCA